MGPEERKIFITFAYVTVFVALVIIYFFINIYSQQRKYRTLEKDKLNAEINASLQERSLIATELHNDIGPFLASLKMRLDLLETSNISEMEACKAALDKCVSQIRGMAKDLAPLSIFEIPFQEALIQYISDVNVNHTLDIKFTEITRVHLPADYNNQLYRILQEIILNTIKHANASLLLIEISTERGNLFIQTSDNGIGFDIKEIRSRKKLGLGLLSINNKIDYLKGTFSISEDFSNGTKYNILIPIPNTVNT
jgi:two-component system NarL family sensor kinase